MKAPLSAKEHENSVCVALCRHVRPTSAAAARHGRQPWPRVSIQTPCEVLELAEWAVVDKAMLLQVNELQAGSDEPGAGMLLIRQDAISVLESTR